MHFGSAQWFYATAAWAQRHGAPEQAIEVLLGAGNEIDERNGVIPPVKPKQPPLFDWAQLERPDARDLPYFEVPKVDDPPEFSYDRRAK